MNETNEQKEVSAELIARAQEGYHDAFHEIYDRLSDRLFSYCLKRTGNRDVATDILQETFIDLWQSLKRFRYRSDEAFLGFVFLILKRRLAKWYRSQRPTVSLDEIVDEVVFVEDLDLKSDMQTIEKALYELSDTYREVVELRYWSGFSFKEIAGLLKTKESTVKVRHHRALKKLQALIISYEERS